MFTLTMMFLLIVVKGKLCCFGFVNLIYTHTYTLKFTTSDWLKLLLSFELKFTIGASLYHVVHQIILFRRSYSAAFSYQDRMGS